MNIDQCIYASCSAFTVPFNLLFAAVGEVASIIKSDAYPTTLKLYLRKNDFPLEHANAIVIKDSRGVDDLLERTREAELEEWGTFLVANHSRGKAIIEKILEFEEAKRIGIVDEGYFDRLGMDATKADELGYNGSIHYHPGFKIFGALDFHVHHGDRYNPGNWINLLTFNLRRGPEIIGYNRTHLYLREDSRNNIMVRASPIKVLQHLSKKAQAYSS